MARAHAHPRQRSGIPKPALSGRQSGNDAGRDPANERDAQAQLVAHTILKITEGKRARSGGKVEHEDEHHGLLRFEANDLLSINRRNRYRHHHAALIKHGAQEQAHEVLVTTRLPECAFKLLP